MSLIVCAVVVVSLAGWMYWRANGGSWFAPKDYVAVGLVPESGITLAGRYYPSAGKVEDRGVILLHQLGGSQNDWTKFAQKLQRENFEVITLDFRGHGESSGDWEQMTTADYAQLVDDAAEAIEYLQDINGNMRIAVVGASIGANVALELADQSDVITTAVLLSPSKNYKGIDITTINKNIMQPVLYVASQDDQESAMDTEKLHKASGSTQKTLKIYPQGGHGIKLLQHTKELRLYIIDWLNQTL